MGTEQYREPKKLNSANQRLLDQIIGVVEDYGQQGYKLTLRQLYYQLVSQDIIPNTMLSYKKIGKMLADARMCGQVDWNIIEDRVRVPKIPSSWDGIQDIVKSALYSYRRNRWQGQDNYVEVWVEKDALSGVLLPITQEYHVHLMVNKGYSSVSAMHDAALRIMDEQDDKSCTILYFGDHDPSGEDMVRDIKDRLTEFGCDIEVEKVALTMAQIQRYNPPPNPVKMTDSRAGRYTDRHGDESWELDALKPQVLKNLVTSNIQNLLDMDKFQDIVERENAEKRALEKFAKDYAKKHPENED